jgi:DNA-binding transcriptional MerR regulator/precorrin-6B methylase 2
MGDTMTDKRLYTAGIFAKKAGVTIKTIRFYDKRGLLKPSEYSDTGYRLYSDEDFSRLQRILTLKYLGFSLAEIKEFIIRENEESNLKESLKTQKEILKSKINHMNLVVKTISEAEEAIGNSKDIEWNKIIDIINVINMEKGLLNQYRDSSNLTKRISIHDKFSTNKIGWHKWVFDKIKLLPNMRVLEIGCGDGSLWARNIHSLPDGCNITLTDVSEGMIKDAKNNLKEFGDKFQFEVLDANEINFEDESFDLVIANHVLFYIKNRDKVFSQIKRILKNNGYFYCSTVGETHMKELEQLIKGFNKELVMCENNMEEDFTLESGKNQLEKWFKEVKQYNYEDELIVTEVEPLAQYVYSTHGNVKEILEGRYLDFEDYIKKEIDKEGKIHISKSTGLFQCKK